MSYLHIIKTIIIIEIYRKVGEAYFLYYFVVNKCNSSNFTHVADKIQRRWNKSFSIPERKTNLYYILFRLHHMCFTKYFHATMDRSIVHYPNEFQMFSISTLAQS